MQRTRKRKRRCGGGGARVYRIDVREQAGRQGQSPVCVCLRTKRVAIRTWLSGFISMAYVYGCLLK
jgi:hypothetical protein